MSGYYWINPNGNTPMTFLITDGRETREVRCTAKERASVLRDWNAGGASWRFTDGE